MREAVHLYGRRALLGAVVAATMPAMPQRMNAATPVPLKTILALPGFAEAQQFDADYADDLHPLCQRHVSVERVVTSNYPEGRMVAHFAGTDVGPPGIGAVVKIGCDEDSIKDAESKRSGLREWSFDAYIDGTGDNVDAGDNVHVGRWHPAIDEDPTASWEGIRWKDGNRWVVISKPSTPLRTASAAAPAADAQ